MPGAWAPLPPDPFDPLGGGVEGQVNCLVISTVFSRRWAEATVTASHRFPLWNPCILQRLSQTGVSVRADGLGHCDLGPSQPGVGAGQSCVAFDTSLVRKLGQWTRSELSKLLLTPISGS